MSSGASDVTELLRRLARGDRSAIEPLMPLVYAELHRRATLLMRNERKDHTLQPTALVHEAYLQLVRQREPRFADRAHFYALAAHLMRRILIDHARARLCRKRGGMEIPLSLDPSLPVRTNTPSGLLALDEALKRLACLDPRQEQIIEMRYFGGLTVAETAEALSLSRRTVEREWTMARAWLYAQLSGNLAAG